MTKKIEILRSWRPGKTLIHTGVYRIPADMSEDLAARAVKEHVGVMLELPAAKPRKAPAPENKAQPPAPENKAGGRAPADPAKD